MRAPRTTATRRQLRPNRVFALASVFALCAALSFEAGATESVALAKGSGDASPLLAMNGVSQEAFTSSAWDDATWLDDEFSLDDEFGGMSHSDPWEPFNRPIFAFNGLVDRGVLTPVTKLYRAVLPGFVRKGVANVFMNIDAPVRIANMLLQRRPRAAGIALGRFVTNSTLGLGGLFDGGVRLGLEPQKADFGQTLASWGVPRGPYLVFPFLGPMTVRNGLGQGVDLTMQPISYIIGPLPGMLMGVGRDLSRREQAFLDLQALEESSIDFYAALRSAFLQDRAALDDAGGVDAAPVQLPSTGSEWADRTMLDAETLERQCLESPRMRIALLKISTNGAARRLCRESSRQQ